VERFDGVQTVTEFVPIIYILAMKNTGNENCCSFCSVTSHIKVNYSVRINLNFLSLKGKSKQYFSICLQVSEYFYKNNSRMQWKVL